MKPKIKILLVDGNAWTRHVTHSVLSQAGYTVTDALAAPSFFEGVRVTRPDLIIFSQDLPDLTILQASQWIQSEAKGTPIVHLTSFSSSPLNCPVDGYLPRPTHHRELISSIQSILQATSAKKTAQISSFQQSITALLSQRLLTSPPSSIFIKEVLSGIMDTMRADFCEILQFINGRFLLKAGRGWKLGLIGQSFLDEAADPIAYAVARTQLPVCIENSFTKEYGDCPHFRRNGIRSCVRVPIITQDGLYGILGAHMKDTHSFRKSDIEFMQTLANFLALALAFKHKQPSLVVHPHSSLN